MYPRKYRPTVSANSKIAQNLGPKSLGAQLQALGAFQTLGAQPQTLGLPTPRHITIKFYI